MTILDLQRRIREAGRIRIGQKVGGNGRPTKLDTFRITSPDRRAIEGVAELYGGEPARWQAPSGQQWEVVTTSDELHVVVPPSEMAFSQWYEQWSGGGCQRRCDGVTEQLTEGPCLCDPEARECKPTTRLSVMLRDLAGLGVWRLESHGHYAAVELAGAVQVCMAAAGAGVMLPARLRLEPRVVKREGEPTRNFAVPVLDVEITPAQLLGGGGGGVALGTGQVAAAPALGPDTPGKVAELPAGTDAPPEPPAAPLQPVPSTVRERPVASVQDQLASGQQRRKSQAAPIPRTGLAPRTAADAEAGAPPPRESEPEGVEPVDELQLLTKAKLQLRCRDAGLPTSGNKDELVARLREHGTSGSATTQEAPEPDDDGGARPFDRDGAQKAFHARLRDLDLDYDGQVRRWMEDQYGVTLSKLPNERLATLLDAMDKRPDQFIAAVQDHAAASSPSAAGGGEAPAVEATVPETSGEVAPEPDGPSSGEGPSGAATASGEPSLADRAYAHAQGTSDTIEHLQRRIREAWRSLAVTAPNVYEAGWERARKALGHDPSQSDWSGGSEASLRALAADMERAAAEHEDGR